MLANVCQSNKFSRRKCLAWVDYLCTSYTHAVCKKNRRFLMHIENSECKQAPQNGWPCLSDYFTVLSSITHGSSNNFQSQAWDTTDSLHIWTCVATRKGTFTVMDKDCINCFPIERCNVCCTIKSYALPALPAWLKTVLFTPQPSSNLFGWTRAMWDSHDGANTSKQILRKNTSNKPAATALADPTDLIRRNISRFGLPNTVKVLQAVCPEYCLHFKK